MNRRSFLRSLIVAPLAVVPGVAAAQCGPGPKPEGYTELLLSHPTFGSGQFTYEQITMDSEVIWRSDDGNEAISISPANIDGKIIRKQWNGKEWREIDDVTSQRGPDGIPGRVCA